MKIVIAGAGSVGRSVALELLDHGHDVTLIDKNPDQLRVASVADAEWILADACSPEALSEAGVRDADVVLAATGDDKANLVLLHAKTIQRTSGYSTPLGVWTFPFRLRAL